MGRYFPLWFRRLFSSFISKFALAASFFLLLILMMSKSTRKKGLPAEYIQNRQLIKELQTIRYEQERVKSIEEKEKQKLREARYLEEKHLKQRNLERQQPQHQLLHQQQSQPQQLQQPEQPQQKQQQHQQQQQKQQEQQVGDAAKKLKEINSALKRDESASNPAKPAAVKRKSNKKNSRSVCGMKTVCGDGEVGYSITSAYNVSPANLTENLHQGGSKTDYPVICVDDVEVLSKTKNNAGRGINVAIFDTVKEKVTATRIFDTYSESDTLHHFLRSEVDNEKILLFATFDDASNALKDIPKNWIKKYGSTKIGDMKFRGSWVLIGQRGVDSKHVNEAIVNAAKNPEFASAAQMSGCFKTPELGSLSVVGIPDDLDGFLEKGTKEAEAIEANCGLKEKCYPGEFPVYISSGEGNSEYLRICYDGVYYMEKGVNDAGRGVNVIVVDGKTKKVTKRANFDTYSEDSTQLEIFLGVVPLNDVIFLVTFDDATTNLGSLAKKLLKSYGAEKVDDFASKFRSAYYLVARQGSPGKTLWEEVSVSDGKAYPPSLKHRGCLRI